MFWAICISFLAGFAAGWATFKHRQDLKDKAREQILDRVRKGL